MEFRERDRGRSQPPARQLHPELSAEDRRCLFWRGIELFNRAEFFDSHEQWEEIWRSSTPEPRDLFQGLIQLAAGMHLFLDRGRSAAATRVLVRGRRRLQPFGSMVLGLDLAGLMGTVSCWEAWLVTCVGEPPPLPVITVLAPEQVR